MDDTMFHVFVQPVSDFVVGVLYGPGMINMMKRPDNGSIMIDVVSEVLKFASGSMSNAWTTQRDPLSLMDLGLQLALYAQSMGAYVGGRGNHVHKTSPIDRCLGVLYNAYLEWHGAGDAAVLIMQQDIFRAFVTGGPPAWYPVPTVAVRLLSQTNFLVHATKMYYP